MNKYIYRVKRLRKTRSKIRKLNKIRLLINRTNRHIYAQITSSSGSETLVSASTLEKKISNKLTYTGNKNSAAIIGEIIAKRALDKNIKNVSFDRSGFKYHGRIQALANAARKTGLKF